MEQQLKPISVFTQPSPLTYDSDHPHHDVGVGSDQQHTVHEGDHVPVGEEMGLGVSSGVLRARVVLGTALGTWDGRRDCK